MTVEIPGFHLDNADKSIIPTGEYGEKTTDRAPYTTTTTGIEDMPILATPSTTIFEPTTTSLNSTTISDYDKWTIVGGVLTGVGLLALGGSIVFCTLGRNRRNR